MKQFTMSMFSDREHLLEAKCDYLEGLLADHIKLFEWVNHNPSCHPENIRKEILRLLEVIED